MKYILLPPDIPIPRGPNCGIYALTAVARALDPEKFSHLYATRGDHLPKTSLKNTHDSLRKIAKNTYLDGHSTPITQIGEIFSSAAMVHLALRIGLRANILFDGTNLAYRIKDAIVAGRYVLAPFGVNDNGQPQDKGVRAHWCIIYGYAENYQGEKMVYVTHWGNHFQFMLTDLQISSFSLQPFSETWQKIGSNLQFGPIGQMRVPIHAGTQNLATTLLTGKKKFIFNADLPNDLAGQFVEVWM